MADMAPRLERLCTETVPARLDYGGAAEVTHGSASDPPREVNVRRSWTCAAAQNSPVKSPWQRYSGHLGIPGPDGANERNRNLSVHLLTSAAVHRAVWLARATNRNTLSHRYGCRWVPAEFSSRDSERRAESGYRLCRCPPTIALRS